MKTVRVLWLDAVSVAHWMNIDDVKENCRPHLCETVGHLIEETKEYITIAATFSPGANTSSPQCGDIITIPKGMVKAKKVLKD